MAGDNTAPQRATLVEGETRNFAVSFADELDTSEALTGTPTVAELTSSDLTIANEAVSTAVLTINNTSVAVGEAVQFTVSGQLAATARYRVRITCATDATPAQTLIGYVEFDVATE